MDIKQYISESERRYHFRIKTVVPLSDKEMDRIELAVAKYQPIEVGRPKKTMLQKHPLDFRDIENSEVYIVDVVLALPASPYVLQQDIRQNLNVPEKYVVVRGDNEPIEIDGERLAAIADIEAEAKKRGLRPAPVLGDPDYKEVTSNEGTIYYGDGYNSAFLDYLAKVKAERAETRVDPPNPIFKWLDLPKDGGTPKQDGTNFNAHLKKAEVAAAKAKVPSESVQGNIDTDQQTVERAFMDAKGNRVVIRRKIKGVRGGDVA